MFARRNFVHQRQNSVLDHQVVAARLSPLISSLANTVNSASAASPSSPASSADPSSTDPALTPATQSTKTPDPSSSASSAAASSSSASASASASSNSAASSTSASASTLSSSSSAVLTVSSATPTSAVATPVATTNAPAVVSQEFSSYAFTATSSVLPSSTATTHASSGPSTALIVGCVAGALAGLALVGFLLTWCLRRRDHDDDDFNADAFKRQSAILVDDPVEPPRSYNRRQTMIENHNVSPALAAQVGYGGQNFYGSYDGYGQQPPPEMVQPPVPQAYGAASMGYPAYNDISQQQLSRQPSNAAFLARQPSAAAGYAPPPVPSAPFDQGTHYIDLNRSSVSPYQAAQYADISRHLGTSDPNGTAPRESLAIPDDPLPSPFDDPVQSSGPNASSHVDVDPFRAATVTTASTPQIYGNAAESHQRPDTFYQEGDAYGGI